jgi:hypothetical protein
MHLSCLQGHHHASAAALKAMADGNGTRMPNRPLLVPRNDGPKSTLWDTFRLPELRRRQMVMMTCWCVVSLAYYGVSLALDSLGGSLYVKFFVVSLFEFPSYFAAMMVRPTFCLIDCARDTRVRSSGCKQQSALSMPAHQEHRPRRKNRLILTAAA